MEIIFFLTDDKRIELDNCSEKDVRRLISQFNNGHLMCVGGNHINPNKVISFFAYESEVTD